MYRELTTAELKLLKSNCTCETVRYTPNYSITYCCDYELCLRTTRIPSKGQMRLLIRDAIESFNW